MSRDQYSRHDPCCGVKSHFPLPNLFCSTRARRHAAGARVSKNPGSAAPEPASFNSLLEAPLASFSMPARAPAEWVSRILQLGLCHQWAPGPKPYEAECIFNTEEGISAVCFSSEPVSARCCRAHLLIRSYLRFFTDWMPHFLGGGVGGLNRSTLEAVGLCPESHKPERQPSLSSSHKVSL